jgi:hypothetical protein
MDMVDVDEEGLSLPDGMRYKWSELTITLKIAAIVSLDTVPEPITTMGNTFEGDDARRLLVYLLRETCSRHNEGEESEQRTS